ncbi:Flp pilus assembly protein CpaB [Anianabacter salinae]|uniref:Flp pilus assembly protein CpaB n=1 Tax=Anianabacter salinae TaxID=2851023 RepID=UPI00225E6590|nr:Flp pilus assembly protein CpaB [Anianabacter salinae]MBV0911288.1 Flp pilus assembly protein CpaB [Anianabacter salinae]
MKLAFYSVLVLGVGLAGAAVYMANGYIGQYQAKLEEERAQRGPEIPLTQVIVAQNPLKYGQRITTEDVILVPWPEASLPEGTFSTFEDFFSEGAEILRTATRAIEAMEPVLAVKVTEPGEFASVSSRLDKGMRAFAINVDVTTGVSGFLRPGDTVDVYWTGAVPGGQRGGVTRLIQSSMKLIAVDQMADLDASKPTIARTVTVQATSEQVARLAQAQNSGKLSLALVGDNSELADAGFEIDQNALLGIVAQAPVEEEVVEVTPEKEICTIRTRRGSDIVETVIPCRNN